MKRTESHNNENIKIMKEFLDRTRKKLKIYDDDISWIQQKREKEYDIKNIKVTDLIGDEYKNDPFYKIYSSINISPNHLFYKIWEKEKNNKEMCFTPQHFKIADDIYNGKNVFVTGKAGTGKSNYLRQIIAILRDEYGKSSVKICAPTATAAVNVNAITFHSLFGMTTERKNVMSIVKKLQKNGKSAKLLETRCLIIDEISQLCPIVFEDASHIIQNLVKMEGSNNGSKSYLRPYGGIQLIVFGDFSQIGPITNGKTNIKYCKNTKTWHDLDFQITRLKHIFRQKGDPAFIDILNEVSTGHLSFDSEWKLRSRIVDQSVIDKMDIKPLPIMGRKDDANKINQKHLASLDGLTFTYHPSYHLCYKKLSKGHVQMVNYKNEKNDDNDINWPSKKIITKELDRFRKMNSMDPVVLKKGAQVMLTANIDVENGFVNGLLGKIIDFNEKCFPIIRFENNKTASISNIRREKKLRSGKKKFKDFYLYVRYLPIMLAAAISIHKCQGKTLKMIELSIDKKNIFTYHMAYCALSRATSLEGVYLRNLDPSVIKLDPDVKKFYEEIEEKEKEYIQSFN